MLALDLALVVRHSVSKLNLSLATRGVAFTLAFRIGTNACTWISQECLAKELGVIERNVRRHCKKLQESGILLIKHDPSDKRKNLYSFTDVIFNYAQMSDFERQKCLLFFDENDKNNRSILTGNNVDTGQNRPVNTGQNRPILNSSSAIQDDDKKEEIKTKILPKRKLKEHKRINTRESCVDNFIIPKWLDKQIWEDFKRYRGEIKKTMSLTSQKMAITKLGQLKQEGHNPNEILSEAIIRRWTGIWAIQKHIPEKSNEISSGIRSTYIPTEVSLLTDSLNWPPKEHRIYGNKQ